MRSLRPPPKVVPPRPPAYLFDQPSADPSSNANFKSDNKVKFNESSKPVDISASPAVMQPLPSKFSNYSVPKPQVNFDVDVESEMRALEASLRKMMDNEQGLRDEEPYTEPSKYHLVNDQQRNSSYNNNNNNNHPGGNKDIRSTIQPNHPTSYTSSQYSQKQYPEKELISPRYLSNPNIRNDPIQGIRAQLSPPRRKGGISQLYETDENVRIKAEKQALYSQQLQQQVK
jgi:hypothetical protein